MEKQSPAMAVRTELESSRAHLLPPATSTDALPPHLPPREKRFLSDDFFRNVWTLIRDFVTFTLVLVFYALCWSFGSTAFILDNTFHTQLFERFIHFIEYMDRGGYDRPQ
jgi:hypothetical protein